MLKKYKEWKGMMDDYLSIGDLVDEDFVNYFLTVVRPVRSTNTIIQIGEPCDAVNGQFTYSTIYKTDEGWKYAGNCYAGEITEPTL